MKYKGIPYRVSTEDIPGNISRSSVLTPEVIEKDIFEIKNRLNCDSIRIYGTQKHLLIPVTVVA